MDLNMVAAIGIIILLVLLFLGMNIGVAMLLVGFFGYAYVVNMNAALGVLANVPTTQASTYALTVIPLFVMMGNFAFATGMSSGMYNAGHKLLSRLPGGLSCATIGASALFGAICGSTQATAATIGVIAIPEMRKYGYGDTLSCGSVSSCLPPVSCPASWRPCSAARPYLSWSRRTPSWRPPARNTPPRRCWSPARA